MAYSLRYWYNNKLTDGKIIRLEIYKKDSEAAAMEIGDVVQGISLNIDGGEDNIDAPIVSTSLVMTFCDAYDHPEAEVKKCGNYAEFYTPDATLWKVVLLCKDKGASSFRTLWGGYVTPDSYEEDLTYRGSVTIVARDNIGHMADFPFDAEGDGYGTISFREVIEGAWAKIESPMSLVFHDEWMQTEGVSALDTRMNVSAFDDKSWHEAVEAALYAYGAVLRFIGDNNVKVSPLRYMSNYGGSVTHSEPVFMTGATRMLTPAVKRIEETASYELANYFDKPPTVNDLSGEVYDVNDGMIQTWPLSNTSGTGWANPVPSLSPIFNPTAYDLLDGFVNDEDREHIYDDIYILTSSNQNSLSYSKYIYAYNFEVELLLGRIIYVEKNNSQNKFFLASGINAKINYIKYGISIEKNGIQQWLKEDGSWGAGQTEITLTRDDGESIGGLKVALNLPVDVSGVLLFTLHIFEIGSNIAFSGCVALKGVSFSCENTSLLQTNRVNTNFNEENNVIITRDPAIAPAYNTTFLPSVIKNGIFYAEGLAYKPAKAWSFAGDTPQQMAVYNHLQLLAYYAKPNNVIEGSIVNGDVSRFAHIWQFEGKEHILVSGRYNFINGYIEGAILREFARYESLWGSTGSTQLPTTETSNETNVEASASSSSSANTYENTTVVNIGIGGGGSGASYLGDLKDVDTTAVVGGSVLYFNGTQWVDKTLQMVLNELKQLGDWFYKTEDGKSIGTKYNFFSEGEMSANGLNLGGGTSGGGGLIQNVLGKSAFGTVASEDNATTFNAYAIDSLYKRIVELEGKDVEVDLSDYYTKQQTQNAITSALSPYIKATDADGKYAALASFNALQSSFDRLYSALNDDTSGVINTWNEVVDFVNEYSGSEDLSTILGKMNTDINARVKVSDFDTWKTDVFNPLSVTVTNLGKKVDTNTANINKLLGWFNVDADGNLFTTLNFYSTKEISANGISQGTGGGGSGLISSVLGVGSLGATLANDNSVVFNAYATNEIYKATQGHASRIGVLESQVGQLTTQGTKVSVSDLLTTGTKIATITVDGVPHEVKGDFLPTSGGTIDGNLMVNGNVLIGTTTDNSNGKLQVAGNIAMGNSSDSELFMCRPYINRFIASAVGGSFAWRVNGSDTDVMSISTTGAVTMASTFTAAGGTIKTDRDYYPLVLATSAELGQTGIKGKIGTTDTGALVFSEGNTYLYNYKSKIGLGIYDGIAKFGTNTLIHSGNVGDYEAGRAKILSDYAGRIQSANLNSFADNGVRKFIASTSMTEGKPPYDGSILHFSWDNNMGFDQQLFLANSSQVKVNERMAWRAQHGGVWGDWKTIAFTDSNVASATKLEDNTAFTAWGQTFFENGKPKNVTGHLNLGLANLQVSDGSASYKIVRLSTSYGLHFGDEASEKYDTLLWGKNINLVTGTNGQTRLYVVNNGNVLIGTTTDNSNGKLQVAGNIAMGNSSDSELFMCRPHINRFIASAVGGSFAWRVNGSDTDVMSISTTGAVSVGSTLTIAGATTHNGIAYFGGTTYYINTSGNTNFNAISGSSLQVNSAAFNDTIHSNEYSGSVAKWSITKDGAASFASLSNGGLLETSTLRVSSTSTFTGKTNHNGGIGATSLNVSGTSTLSGHVGIGANPHSTYSLYVDGSLCCGPIDGGTASLGALYSNTHVPNFSETYDLGSTSYRWASIYGVGADLSGNLTVNGTLYANGTLYTNDIDGSDIYITASGDLYLHTLTGYVGANNGRWAIDGYGNYKGQSLYINPRDNDNEIITDNNKKKTHGFPREGVAVFVNGDIAATGEISANALNQGSDIRFKHQLGDITLDLDTIANAPMFRFTWTNKENSKVQIGTSAQYWKDSARELVNVDKDDFHRLDYATLGVLIGVTLGKTVKNHEDRIKELETKVESLEAENRRLRYGN